MNSLVKKIAFYPKASFRRAVRGRAAINDCPDLNETDSEITQTLRKDRDQERDEKKHR